MPENKASVLQRRLADEAATIAAGIDIGAALEGQGIVFLYGEMGAGKTTFCRGILRQYGYQGAVKSPTYTLVEPYNLPQHSIFHFDLFRLTDGEELYYLGIEDYFSSPSICLIEWPEKGAEFLPSCDLKININNHRQTIEKNGKTCSKSGASGISEGRIMEISAHTDYGNEIINKISAVFETVKNRDPD